MTEEQVRGIVRAAIARRRAEGRGPEISTTASGALAPTTTMACASVAPFVAVGHDAGPAVSSSPIWLTHASHLALALATPEEHEPCLVEPETTCNRCGFCQSLGH